MRTGQSSQSRWVLLSSHSVSRTNSRRRVLGRVILCERLRVLLRLVVGVLMIVAPLLLKGVLVVARIPLGVALRRSFGLLGLKLCGALRTR